MTQADPPPIAVDPSAVIHELCADPLGRALWERAQWRVAADVLQGRVVELEQQKAPAVQKPAVPPAAGSTEA